MRCLIVEDQEPARRLLQHYLSKVDELELVDACSSAAEALTVMNHKPVDVMFLDLHLPQTDGLSFMRRLKEPPKIIVTTAYAEHALEAFDLDVVDYLLKPIEFERFCRAIDRARGTSDQPQIARNKTKFIKVGRESVRINLDDIVYIASDGNFLYLVMEHQQFHILGTLQEWEKNLKTQDFLRTHRSYLVNSRFISKVSQNEIETPLGMIPIGRSYKRLLVERLSL